MMEKRRRFRDVGTLSEAFQFASRRPPYRHAFSLWKREISPPFSAASESRAAEARKDRVSLKILDCYERGVGNRARGKRCYQRVVLQAREDGLPKSQLDEIIQLPAIRMLLRSVGILS